MRLIDADKFKAVLICGTEGHEDTFDDGICYMLNKIDEAPTVDAEPVQHGRWVKSKDGYHRCSVCESRGSAIKAQYCHHCGAKMDEVEANKTV